MDEFISKNESYSNNNNKLKVYTRKEDIVFNTLNKNLNIAKKLKSNFQNWYMTLPVVSFNGSKYDINLMKKYLHSSLNKNLNIAKKLKSNFHNWYMTLPVVSFNGSKYDINLMKKYLKIM